MDLLFTTKKNYVETLAVNEEYLIYRCVDRTIDPIQKICIMDLNTKKSKCIFKSENNSRINNAQIICERFFEK